MAFSQLDTEVAGRMAHSEILEHLVQLFEVGSQSVTLCVESNNSFFASRNASIIISLISLRGVAVVGLNAVSTAAFVTDIVNSFPRADDAAWEALLPAPPVFEDSWISSSLKSLGFTSETPGEMQRAVYDKGLSEILNNAKQAHNSQIDTIVTEYENEMWWRYCFINVSFSIISKWFAISTIVAYVIILATLALPFTFELSQQLNSYLS